MLTAAVIVFSQLFYFQAATYCQEKAQTQQKEKEAPVKGGKETSQQAYISIPSNTITSISAIELSDGISFVQEILCEPREDEMATETPALANRFFYTLFRFIIASNAP